MSACRGKAAAVVTGLGLVSPWGPDAAAFRAGLAEGRETDGLLAGFDPHAALGQKGLRAVDRVGRMALVASQEALRDAGLLDDAARLAETGVVLGSAYAGLDSIMGFFTERLTEGANYVTASNFGNIVMNAPAAQLALRFRLPKLNVTVTTGAASGVDALGWAADLIAAGRAPAVLAGGVDEVSPGLSAVLAGRGRLEGPNAWRPGEGAAVLVLESAAHAAARGARVLAEVAGHGQAFDAAAACGEPPTGAALARAVRAALEAAGVGPGGVGLVVRAANGAADLDAAEDAALAEVFGGASPTTVAPKRWLGEAAAAGGGFGAAIAGFAIAAGGPAVALVLGMAEEGHASALVLRRAP